MKKFCTTTLLSLALILLFSISVTHAAVFSRTLTIGSTGEDVRELQKVLNTNVLTQVSVSGIGSPGYESTYFGPLTAAAVSKYQELHATEILFPIGLTVGTGVFGERTRAHMSGETLPSASGGVTVYTNTTGTKFGGGSTGSTGTTPTIQSITPSKGGVGTVVTIKGYGFSPTGNKVGSAFEEFNNVSSADGMTMRVTIKGPFPKEFLE